MPNWVTIYLKDNLTNLSIEDIKQGVSDADWWTLAEDFEIEEEDVSLFMEGLQWKKEGLEIGLAGERPLQVYFWNEPNYVAEVVSELIDETPENDLPKRVTNHLKDVKAIVAIEMGEVHFETMYEIVAFEIAYWLAETKKGLICSPGDLWFDHNKNRWQPIMA